MAVALLDVSVCYRFLTVHKKTDRTQYRFFVHDFGRPREPGPIYQGTHAVTGKHPLVREFFAKYMLQIGYLTYCTTDCK